MNMYMIHLSGQGDNIITLLEDEDVWNWLDDFNMAPPEKLVSAYIEACKEDLEVEGIDLRQEALNCLKGTSGSWSNDRALNLGSGCSQSVGDILGYKTFYSVKETMDYVKKNDVDIIGEYEGYIY